MKGKRDKHDAERLQYALTLVEQLNARYPQREAVLVDDKDAMAALLYRILDTVLPPAQFALLTQYPEILDQVKMLTETVYLLGYEHGRQQEPTIQID